MPRALKNLDISLGLATIPVQLFTATSSQGVAFHLLHARCGSRIQMRIECPIHGIVPREETVKGYEITKDEYVRFDPEELKALEQASSSMLVIDSFVPEGAVDPVYFEDTYYLGAGKNGDRGYRVLTQASRRRAESQWARSPGAGRRRRSQSGCTKTASPPPAPLLRYEVHNATEIHRAPIGNQDRDQHMASGRVGREPRACGRHGPLRRSVASAPLRAPEPRARTVTGTISNAVEGGASAG
jgi:hypothetical protein